VGLAVTSYPSVGEFLSHEKRSSFVVSKWSQRGAGGVYGKKGEKRTGGVFVEKGGKSVIAAAM